MDLITLKNNCVDYYHIIERHPTTNIQKKYTQPKNTNILSFSFLRFNYIYFFFSTMASQGATLQNYNNQLVKCIEDLREKREEVNRQILKEEEEKAKIQKDLAILTERLSKINESLQRKQQARSEYDQTIQETEAAYMKILESSQTLLHVLKRESVNLVKKQGSAH